MTNILPAKPIYKFSLLSCIIVIIFIFGLKYYVGSNSQQSILPNIIIISLDTLRWDAVGVLSETTPSPTPNIDIFSNNSVTYTNAYAPMPYTLPSHMSMYTGLYPIVHEVTNANTVLSEKIKTIPLLLKDKGYRTLGLFNNNWMKEKFGFGRGFDHYEQISHSLNQAEENNVRIFELLEKHGEPQTPLFLFLHYFNIHSDYYENHPPYSSPTNFQIPEYEHASKHFCTPEKKCGTEFLLQQNVTGTMLPKEEITLLKKLYIAGVRYTDSVIGELIAGLKDRDLYNNSLIILTSDHGEEFQEHGRFIHAQTYEECNKVPLFIKFPSNTNTQSQKVDNPVELTDIMSTILATVDIAKTQKTSLYPKFLPSKQRPVLIQHKKDHSIFAMRKENYKIIYNTQTDKIMLFDLQKDAEEQKDLSLALPKVTANLKKIIKQKVSENIKLRAVLAREDSSKEKIEVLTDKEKNRLKSLGYLQ